MGVELEYSLHGDETLLRPLGPKVLANLEYCFRHICDANSQPKGFDVVNWKTVITGFAEPDGASCTDSRLALTAAKDLASPLQEADVV